MTHWIDPQPMDLPAEFRQAVGGHPLVAEALARRGIRTSGAARAFLDPALYTPAAPAELPDLSAAVDRLRQAIHQREPIVVWGDFDADGQTATALLVETLRGLDATVRFRVPSRTEGHGLHQQGLERLISDGARLILTCDTGVTAHTPVARANALGAEVIITDHHVPGDHLPPALAVVNPQRLLQGHPLRPLTGVGVAYQLASALDPELAAQALDLVALGTVADVGALVDDNRYLVQRGLEALRNTARPGLQAVYHAAEIHSEGLDEQHIGFSLGPRLNALGRLADATHGVELLLTDDPVRARIIATEIEGLNARRKWLTRQITSAALAQIEREPSLLSDYRALVLSHPTWPSGVIGIVAGRLAERFGKPVVLISAPPGQPARGSGRSVPGVDLIAALADCAVPEPDAPGPRSPLFKGYGGHPGAAGFAIEPERISELRAALSRAIDAQVETVPQPTLTIDAFVDLPDLSLDLVYGISRLAPFGQGNPVLALAVRDLHIQSKAIVGRTGEHLRLTVEDLHDHTQTVFWWHGAGWPLPQGRFDLAIAASASDYRGVAEVQLRWLDARERAPDVVQVGAGPAFEVIDLRQEDNLEAKLLELGAAGDLQVWAEGQIPAGVETRTRQQLVPGCRLALWTLPPGPRELKAALDRVQPVQVFLFARDPATHDPELGEAGALLQSLVGMVKFALRTREGQVDLEAAAARLAHRVGTIQAGLELLAAQGIVQIVERDQGRWKLARETGCQDPQATEMAGAALDALLAETAAYRAYAREAPASVWAQI
jgi:single-stranded-DNA-specific exonuclease